MAQTPAPYTYGTFQPQFSAYQPPSLESYATQYSVQLGQQQYAYGDYQHQQQPARPPSPDPELPSLDEHVASQALRRLTTHQLHAQGFKKADEAVLYKLELELVAFVTRLYEQANEYANLANRHSPIPTDLLSACETAGIDNTALRRAATGLPKKRKKGLIPPAKPAPMQLQLPTPRPRSPTLLPSEENTQPVIPLTIRALPPPLPRLPPTHSYLRTPIEAPKRAALPSLEKKMKTATLVQGSLKNLMIATEDTTGQEDGELLGHIVNYEVGTHPRKRWKV